YAAKTPEAGIADVVVGMDRRDVVEDQRVTHELVSLEYQQRAVELTREGCPRVGQAGAGVLDTGALVTGLGGEFLHRQHAAALEPVAGSAIERHDIVLTGEVRAFHHRDDLAGHGP